MKFCKKCQCDTERGANGKCKVCEKAYRAANREKIAAYYVANREQSNARRRAWHAANREKANADSKAYYLANLDKIAAYNAANAEKIKAKDAAYYLANFDKIAARRAANPEAGRIYSANRRALKRSTGTLSKGLSTKLFDLQRGKCACCGQPLGDDYHLDHIMPLARGGLNTDENIQLLRSTCNHQKHAKDPIEFMQSRGKLL